jgi:hypothetical protein
MDGSLGDAMRALEEEEALGFTSWWLEMVVLVFSWCRGWRSSWWAGIYIDKTANRHAAGHVPRNPCVLRRALGHKKSHVLRRCVTVHILFKVPNVQLWVVPFLNALSRSIRSIKHRFFTKIIIGMDRKLRDEPIKSNHDIIEIVYCSTTLSNDDIISLIRFISKI